MSTLPNDITDIHLANGQTLREFAQTHEFCASRGMPTEGFSDIWRMRLEHAIELGRDELIEHARRIVGFLKDFQADTVVTYVSSDARVQLLYDTVSGRALLLTDTTANRGTASEQRESPD